jgi:superfamily II DNA/RNA helicase
MQIMYQLPLIVRYEQYVHRVGRTGRTGVADGKASVFFDPKDPNDLQLTEFLGEVRD